MCSSLDHDPRVSSSISSSSSSSSSWYKKKKGKSWSYPKHALQNHGSQLSNFSNGFLTFVSSSPLPLTRLLFIGLFRVASLARLLHSFLASGSQTWIKSPILMFQMMFLYMLVFQFFMFGQILKPIFVPVVNISGTFSAKTCLLDPLLGGWCLFCGRLSLLLLQNGNWDAMYIGNGRARTLKWRPTKASIGHLSSDWMALNHLKKSPKLDER